MKIASGLFAIDNFNESREADHALSGALQEQKELGGTEALKRSGAQRQMEKLNAKIL